MAGLLQHVFTDLAWGVAALLVLIYVWFRVRFAYWKRKGVHGPTPHFPAGNIGGVFMKTKPFFAPYVEDYERFKRLPYYGLFVLYNPGIVLTDPHLARRVLVRDFEHFAMHGTTAFADTDPLSVHLFNLHGDKWRRLRNLITPTFSSAKTKHMFHNVTKASEEMVRFLDSATADGRVVDMSATFSNFTLDVIGGVAFGVDCRCFTDPNSTYMKHVHEFFEAPNTYWRVLRIIWFLAPEFFRWLRVRRIRPELTRFFVSLVRETAKQRAASGQTRKDYLQMLMDIKRETEIEAEKTGCPDLAMTWEEMAGNAMMYLAAGYETSSTTLTFAAYELAQAPHVLERARQEVRDVLQKHGTIASYEAAADMTYLGLIMEEALRKHPPMRSLFRRCTKDYQVPGSKLVIEKGTWAFVPIQAMQTDPDIFPRPHEFDPDRFRPENKTELQNMVYMPFGEGPKICLGLRFGMMITKVALATLLWRCDFTLDPRTPVPLKYKTSSLSTALDPGLFVKLTPNKQLSNSS